MARQTVSTIATRTEGMERRAGFLPLYWDAEAGALLLEIARPEEEFLYLWGLTTGIGSADVMLDRGVVAGSALGRWRVAGGRMLLELCNLRFRAQTENAELARSVE